MPVEWALCEDGQVMYVHFKEPWTMEELFKSMNEITVMRDRIYAQDKTRRVHSLIDMMDVKNGPPNVMQGRNIPGISHPTGGEIVVAAKNEFPRRVLESMLRVMHAEGHFFETLDQAWEYVRGVISKRQ